jgi:hypothetical protein
MMTMTARLDSMRAREARLGREATPEMRGVLDRPATLAQLVEPPMHRSLLTQVISTPAIQA